MIHVGVYDLPWLFFGLGFFVFAFLAAVSKQALLRFSRKELLQKAPAERHEAIEESLSLRDEYISGIDFLGFLLRLGLIICLAMGRFTWLEEQALEEQVAGHATWQSLTAVSSDVGATPAISEGNTAADPRAGEENFAQQARRHFLLSSKGLGAVLINVVVFGVELLAMAVVLLYFLPSLVSRMGAETWLLRFLPSIERNCKLLSPMRDASDRLSQFLAAVFGAREERSNADIVEEEILSAVEEGQREGLLKTRDMHMIESIMNYGDVEVCEVMTPRTEMVALDVEDSLEMNLKKVIDCGHSRIPVYSGVKDKIIGILYVKDLQKYLLRKEEIRLPEIVRKPYFVTEKNKIGELLQEFKRHRQHLAVVQDEHQGTAGLVTIEDILEEIVGEIIDEYESEDNSIRRISRSLAEVDASLHIDDVNERLGIALPEGETYDTLGGYLFETLGRVPVVGDRHSHNGVDFEVIEADQKRVHRLRLRMSAGQPR